MDDFVPRKKSTWIPMSKRQKYAIRKKIQRRYPKPPPVPGMTRK